MMLVDRIEFENFGPYYGRHELKLRGQANEVVLVHGENMAGKTSLLNAIRWGLYGTAKDRQGKAMPMQQLVNTVAYAEGTYRVSVTLDLIRREERGDVRIRLKRQQQGKPGVDAPVADRHFEEHLDVEEDGNILSPAKYDDVVNSLLPERISRFFLFDGELLKEYEELVHEESTAHAREVKRAIELILGVPSVTNGQQDLQTLRGEASRTYNRQAKRYDALEQSAADAERLQDEVERLDEETQRLSARHEGLQQQVLACHEELERHQHLRDDAMQRKHLLEELEARRQEDTAKRAERREHARELWRDVIESRVAHEIEQLERERGEIGRALGERSSLERELAIQRNALKTDTCATCGQPIPEESRVRARTSVSELEERLGAVQPIADQSRHDEIGAVTRRLRGIAPAGVTSAIEQIERDLLRSTATQHKLQRQVEELTDKLRDFDPGVVEEHERRRIRLLKLIGEVEAEISAAEVALQEKRNALRACQRAMSEQDVPSLRRTRAELELYDQAEAVFAASIEQLIAELRGDVEREASEIFFELTTDKTYRGLRINENYGLTIVDKAGDAVPVRSAGAEQIVALSLIGALNRLATTRGPVIMDTPFGRLDRSHRENIMRFVPALADQIILLVHSGELDPERDLEPVRDLVSGEYTIEHLESSKSELRTVER